MAKEKTVDGEQQIVDSSLNTLTTSDSENSTNTETKEIPLKEGEFVFRGKKYRKWYDKNGIVKMEVIGAA